MRRIGRCFGSSGACVVATGGSGIRFVATGATGSASAALGWSRREIVPADFDARRLAGVFPRPEASRVMPDSPAKPVCRLGWKSEMKP
jgi:hypothetical protein